MSENASQNIAGLSQSIARYMQAIWLSQLQLPAVPKPPQSPSSKRLWTKVQSEKLLVACKNYSSATGKPLKDLDAKDFLVISSAFPQTTTQCIVKFREIITSGTIKAGAWSAEEDEVLREMIEEGEMTWGRIAKAINSRLHRGIKVRTGKKCKERWLNYFDPTVKRGNWTTEEDLVLLEEFKKHGKRWKVIINSLENRIESAVKNRVTSLLNYERQEIGSAPEGELLERAISKAKSKLDMQNTFDDTNKKV